MALEMRMWIFFAALGLTAVTQSVRAEPKMPADYVRLRDVTALAVEDMRYAGPHNFTGKRVNVMTRRSAGCARTRRRRRSWIRSAGGWSPMTATGRRAPPRRFLHGQAAG